MSYVAHFDSSPTSAFSAYAWITTHSSRSQLESREPKRSSGPRPRNGHCAEYNVRPLPSCSGISDYDIALPCHLRGHSRRVQLDLFEGGGSDLSLMGGVLDKANTKKCSESGVECGPLRLTWVASAMQGWRMGMEDAHIALPVTLARRPSAAAPWTKTALFGVLDGHGGAQVARFSSDHLPQELRKFPLSGDLQAKNGQMEEALKGAFHKIDELLRSGHFAAEVCALSNPPKEPEPRTQEMRTIITANAGDSRAVLCSAGKAIPLSEETREEENM
eukprot:g33526.t1